MSRTRKKTRAQADAERIEAIFAETVDPRAPWPDAQFIGMPWEIAPGAACADIASPNYGRMTPEAVATHTEACDALADVMEAMGEKAADKLGGRITMECARADLEAMQGRDVRMCRLYPLEAMLMGIQPAAFANVAVLIVAIPGGLHCRAVICGPAPLPRTEAEIRAGAAFFPAFHEKGRDDGSR